MAAITRTPVGQQFIGYFINPSGSISTVNCDSGFTYATSGSIGDCCSATPGVLNGVCNLKTACTNGNQILAAPTGVVGDCGTTRQCRPQYIYETGVGGSAVTKYICADNNYNALTIYRTIVTTSGSITTTSAPSSNISNTSAASSSAASSSSASSSANSSSLSSSSSSSKAWIAGAVIGPIVGLALVAAVIIFAMRHRKSKTNGAAAVATEPAPSQYHEDYKYHSGISSSEPAPSELHSEYMSRPISELPGSEVTDAYRSMSPNMSPPNVSPDMRYSST